MSQFSDIQRRKYTIIRGASQGADISLVTAYDGFHAGFECAARVAEVLGFSGLKNWGSESDPVMQYTIPLTQMPKACEKLSQRFSIALLDQLPNEKGNIAWGLIWKIKRGEGGTMADAPAPAKKDYKLEDF